MATHGCILCPGCRSGCPLCGRCQCKVTDLGTYKPLPKIRTIWDSLNEAIAREIDEEVLRDLFPDKNDEQKPETD